MASGGGSPGNVLLCFVRGAAVANPRPVHGSVPLRTTPVLAPAPSWSLGSWPCVSYGGISTQGRRQPAGRKEDGRPTGGMRWLKDEGEVEWPIPGGSNGL